jgi:hypothetical protein
MLPDLTAHVFRPGVELLREALRQGLMLGVYIPPSGRLGPESEDAQQRHGQRSLLALREPRLIHVDRDRHGLSPLFPS